jgi:Protein of unknown function (DUF1207)
MDNTASLMPAGVWLPNQSAAWMRVAQCVLWVSVFHAIAEAQSVDNRQRPPTWTVGSGSTLTLFPSGDVYNVYIADPQRPTNAITELVYPHVDIEASSSPRSGLAAGGQFGILRIAPAGRKGRSWQVSISAGFDALFDAPNELDVIGWDGNYGLTVTTATEGRLALKAAVLHVSSHLGDEYQDRTGRTRINYTREELAVGSSWRLTRGWRAYGETGVAYKNRSELQEPWRLQGGIEHESQPTVWGSRFAWYAAADFSAMEERGWRLDTALQGGILTRTNGRTFRLGVGWTDGRPTIGEFFQESESWFTFGIYVDL